MRVEISDCAAAAEAIDRLIAQSTRIVGFTGAGLSTECGVPDFRSPGSPWMVNKPIPYEAYVTSAAARTEAWRRKFTMDDHYAGARPGRGTCRLCPPDRGRGACLPSSPRISTACIRPPAYPMTRCWNCMATALTPHVSPVRCATNWPRCGPSLRQPGCRRHAAPVVGIVKSATISFGQAMPQEKMQKAQELAMTCDLFLAAGSSLVVFPAAHLPALAARQGARLVIINREATALDDMASLLVRADIGDVLERVAWF